MDWSELVGEARLMTTVIEGQGNVGYGRGHNLAIERTSSRYHLILNPDIELGGDALQPRAHIHGSSSGGRSPFATDPGRRWRPTQFLCRRYPTVFDLFARGFLPSRLRAPFKNRLAHYEMRDVIDGKNIVWDPPIVSGCFMLFRTDVLKKLGGFDPRYFLYFEDYDLSLRTHKIARVAYVPSVRVLHHRRRCRAQGLDTHQALRDLRVQVFQPIRLEMDMSDRRIAITGANGSSSEGR